MPPALGFATKRFAAYGPTAGEDAGQLTPGKAFCPARLHMKVLVVARLFAKEPAAPLLRNVTNAELEKFAFAALPKAVVVIGTATWPARPQLAKLLEDRFFADTPQAACAAVQAAAFAWQIARLFRALLNSPTNPFSKILTSLMFSWRQRPVP